VGVAVGSGVLVGVGVSVANKPEIAPQPEVANANKATAIKRRIRRLLIELTSIHAIVVSESILPQIRHRTGYS
jgi:hypothetical protein